MSEFIADVIISFLINLLPDRAQNWIIAVFVAIVAVALTVYACTPETPPQF